MYALYTHEKKNTPVFSDTITVEPPNKGHFGDNICCVFCREVVLSSEVQNVIEL